MYGPQSSTSHTPPTAQRSQPSLVITTNIYLHDMSQPYPQGIVPLSPEYQYAVTTTVPPGYQNVVTTSVCPQHMLPLPVLHQQSVPLSPLPPGYQYTVATNLSDVTISQLIQSRSPGW